MPDEIKQTDTTNPEVGGEEGEGQPDVVKIPKADYDKLNQTLGSLKRELKDLKKPKEETNETSKTNQNNKPNEDYWSQKFEKMSFRQAGITHEDDRELALKTAKKWNMDLDDVLADEDFQIKLGKQQNARANLEATTGIKGDKGTQVNSKLSPEYWVAKGQYPSKSEVPDRATRTKIREAIIAQAKGTSKKFYND